MKIKSIQRSLRQHILRPTKRLLIRVLLKAITTLDETLAHNLVVESDKTFLELDDAQHPADQQSVCRTHENVEDSTRLSSESVKREVKRTSFVVNERSSIVSVELLAIYLRAIFPGADLALMRQMMWQSLAKTPDRWCDVFRLHQSLKHSLQSGQFDVSEPVRKKLLSCLDQHSVVMRDNADAYKSDTKPNQTAVYWPNPIAADSRSIFEELPFVTNLPLIDEATPIGSAGSCFAIEIARRLQANGFNYIVTEPLPDKNGFSQSPAQWGIIFNTASFRQLIEKSFGIRELPKILWTSNKKHNTIFHDPFREDVVFSSLRQYEATYESHRQAAREALTQSEVFVLTLGMNEVWGLRGSNTVFSRCPWRLAPGIVERRVLSVDDNVYELQTMLNLWRVYNPKIKLIISVSPVPFHATFRGAEHHVITANTHSKATLRVAAEKFCAQNQDVYYFPSYETVTCCTQDPWHADQRHVSPNAVDNVMRLFEKMFVQTKSDTLRLDAA